MKLLTTAALLIAASLTSPLADAAPAPTSGLLAATVAAESPEIIALQTEDDAAVEGERKGRKGKKGERKGKRGDREANSGDREGKRGERRAKRGERNGERGERGERKGKKGERKGKRGEREVEVEAETESE